MYYLVGFFILILPTVMFFGAFKFKKQSRLLTKTWLRLAPFMFEGSLLVYIKVCTIDSPDYLLMGVGIAIIVLQIFLTYLTIHLIEHQRRSTC